MPRPSQAVSSLPIEDKADAALEELSSLVEYLEKLLCDFTDINGSTRELEANDKQITNWIRTFDRDHANKLRDVTHQERLLQTRCEQAEQARDEATARALERRMGATSLEASTEDEVMKQERRLEELEAEAQPLREEMAQILKRRQTVAKTMAKLEHYAYKDIDLYKATVAALMSVTQLKWTEMSSKTTRGTFIPTHSVKHVKNFEVQKDDSRTDTAERLWDQISAFSMPADLDLT